MENALFKYFFGIFIFLVSVYSYAEYARKEITVMEVGLSHNTNRVFVIGSPEADNSPCPTKGYYSISLDNPSAYLFYSVALSAMNEDRMLRVQYDTTGGCIGNGPGVEVFWSLKN